MPDKVLVTKDKLDALANAVSENSGESTPLTIDQMTRIVGTMHVGGDANNPTIDMQWDDVYCEWQAGYYYDPDNNYTYTQIPSTETIWSTAEARISVSCTPYSNMIPVQPGEEYIYMNPPVHFDSKNAEIPSIIIFDSNKSRIASYTRTYQDREQTFTIPTGGVWMAVINYNSQEWLFQKHNAKEQNKQDILANVMADYRSYTLTVPPVTNTLTKAYICLGTDDLRPSHTKNLHTLFTNNNIPYYMAAIPSQAKVCIQDDPYKTNLDYMRLCVAAGGEIVGHVGDDLVITESNKNDFDTMYRCFCLTKKELEAYGFDVRGFFKAGGENAIYGQADPIIDAWATHYYEFGDDFTTALPYDFGRTMMDDWADYSALGNAIQTAVQNKSYFIGTFHYYNANAALAISTILSALSGYTEGTDYEFVTPSQLYDILMPSTRPSSGGGGSGSSITYTISMSNNVITLTGSNGSTSTVTLPVYNGGVSS